MAITYSGNIITVTGYTEASPCTFDDIYDADKAGTLSLHARTGITAADTDPVAVDRAERPADYVVLGGASNDLYITIANWVGTTATIRITGTDRDGAAQTEDIVVTANGDYYTTKWFKTITHTQVTAFTGTSFDYDLTQGQWGVVWNQGTDQFTFDVAITIGDGSTITYFIDDSKEVIINGDINFDNPSSGCYAKFTKSKIVCNNIYTHNYAVVYFGEIESGAPVYGCLVKAGDYIKSYDYSKICIYDSFIETKYLYNYGLANYSYSEHILERTSVRGHIEPAGYLGKTKLTDVVIEDGSIRINKSPYYDWVGIKMIHPYSPAILLGYGGHYTFKNIEVIDPQGYILRFGGNIQQTAYFINPVLPASFTINYFGDENILYLQYEFDLKVIDKDGNNIDGATVKIWDKDGTLVVDTTTDANGVIATQTITRGYYNQTNGNTLQDYSPHLIKVEKAGYTTYEADFTLEEKTDWTIALQGVLKRNPAMTGGMV